MWKQWWPYKGIVLIVVLLLAVSNIIMTDEAVTIGTSESSLSYTDGMRAATFALIAAAAALFITRLPKNAVEQDEQIDRLSHALSIVTAFGAGLFWLLAETGRNTYPYLWALFIATGALAFWLSFGILMSWVVESIKRRLSRGQGSGV